MKLPIGYSDFKKIIDERFDFVDKSLFIKEVIDDAEAILITRPRRFGKTLNMSMLRYYFSAEINGQSYKKLFDNLKIMCTGNYYLQHQGKYPIIFLTLKDIKETTFDLAYASFCKIIKDLYSEHRYLLSSAKLYEEDKVVYTSILKQEATPANIAASLKDLTKYLYLHFGIKPLILIDEYDTPIQSGYLHQYYDQIVNLFRNFFSAALKDNPYLFKSVLIGILRVSKESLFSGLNNLKVYSVLNAKYSEHFGFTETEVADLLEQSQLKNKAHEIKQWYNGYQIGHTILYNPWSIINCIEERGLLKSYWVSTSDNTLIKNLILKSSSDFKEQFELLLQNHPIERLIDENFVFGDLQKNHATAVWNLLLLTGYLKIISYQETDQGPLCRLAIPNQEIRNLYRKIIEQWLSNGYGIEWYNRFLNHLLIGNMEDFERDLSHIMEQTVSVHDVAKEPEAFYHGLMIGLTASLYGNPHYEIKSNRESGTGRYDYLIFSKDPEKLTILIEFKQVKTKDKTDQVRNDLLITAAQAAVTQISQRNYIAESKQRGVKKILNLGIAFSGKQFRLAYESLIL